MAIQKRFIHFKKFSDFNSKKLSANEANTQYTIGVSGEVQTGAPDILYQSYCWIKDTRQQWTHGQLYDCNPNDDASSSVYITDFDVFSLYNLTETTDGSIQFNSQSLVEALAANKIVLVPYEISEGVSARGYAALVGYVEDLLYFKVITNSYELIVETSFDDPTIYSIDIDYRDFNNKQDRLISGTNIKTINGKSLLGSGDTIISGYEWKVQIYPNQTWTLVVDYKFMITNTLNGPLTIQLPTTNPTSDNYTKECGITFTTGSTAPTIRFNGDIWWVNGTAPTIDANCVYEFSFKFNFANNTWLGVYASFKTE